jgi:hypothetical protein
MSALYREEPDAKPHVQGAHHAVSVCLPTNATGVTRRWARIANAATTIYVWWDSTRTLRKPAHHASQSWQDALPFPVCLPFPCSA